MGKTKSSSQRRKKISKKKMMKKGKEKIYLLQEDQADKTSFKRLAVSLWSK